MSAVYEETHRSVQADDRHGAERLPADSPDICLLLQSILRLSSNDNNRNERWVQELDVLYSELERRIEDLDLCNVELILKDRRIGPRFPELYAIRAQWEERLETMLSRRALCADSPIRAVQSEVDRKINMLPQEFFDSIAGRERVLFVGSGPFPTTAMAIARVLNRPVTCLDFNHRANALASEFLDAGEYSERVSVMRGALETFDDIANFDTIVAAFLVGVSTTPQEVGAKSRLVSGAAKRLQRGGRMVLRTSLGGGELIYPAVEAPNNVNFCVNTIPDPSALPVPYDVPIMTIDRLG